MFRLGSVVSLFDGNISTTPDISEGGLSPLEEFLDIPGQLISRCHSFRRTSEILHILKLVTGTTYPLVLVLLFRRFMFLLVKDLSWRVSVRVVEEPQVAGRP